MQNTKDFLGLAGDNHFLGIATGLCPNIPEGRADLSDLGWEGEGFQEGRPKIPEDPSLRAKKIGSGDEWIVLNNEGYINQFKGNRKTV